MVDVICVVGSHRLYFECAVVSPLITFMCYYECPLPGSTMHVYFDLKQRGKGVMLNVLMLACAPSPTNVSQGFHLRTLEYMHVQVFV